MFALLFGGLLHMLEILEEIRKICAERKHLKIKGCTVFDYEQKCIGSISSNE